MRERVRNVKDKATWRLTPEGRISSVNLTPYNALPIRGVRLLNLDSGQSDEVAVNDRENIYPVGFSRDGRFFCYVSIQEELCRLVVVECGTSIPLVVTDAIDPSVIRNGETPAKWLGSQSQLLFHRRAKAFDGTYVSTRLMLVAVETNRETAIGGPIARAITRPSPDGNYVLVTRDKTTDAHTDRQGEQRVTEVWSLRDSELMSTAQIHRQVDCRRAKPATDDIRLLWHPFEAASIIKLQRNETSHDGVSRLRPPFVAIEPLCELDNLCVRLWWTKKGHLLTAEWKRDNNTIQLRVRHENQASRLIASMTASPELTRAAAWAVDSVQPPGQIRPLQETLDNENIVAEHDNSVYLCSVVAERQMLTSMLIRQHLDRDDITSTRIGGISEYERPVCMYRPPARIITICQDKNVPPHYSLARLQEASRVTICEPSELDGQKGVLRRYIKMPSHYDPDSAAHLYTIRRGASAQPAILWIHPTTEYLVAPGHPLMNEFLDTETLPLPLLFDGYVLVHMPPLFMPVRDSTADIAKHLTDQLDQIVAVLKKDRLVDTTRLILGGQCLGAYAAALVLSRSLSFRAGILCSGTYNLANYPMGSAATGHRALWEAPGLFMERSPVVRARSMRTPVLIIEGEDEAPRGRGEGWILHRAISESGGISRYVQLPCEGRIYDTVEGRSIAAGAMSQWCQRYVASADVTV
jgi:dipeptidyl aminopeptidase/acylaminoacyl peptidase